MPPHNDADFEDKQVGTSASGASSYNEKTNEQSAGHEKKGRGFLEEGLNRQPLKFDAQFDADLIRSEHGSKQGSDDKHHRWEELQAEWKSNWESIPIDSDSRGADLSGKGKAKATPFSTLKESHGTPKHRVIRKALAPRRSVDLPLQWTRQKAPFHSSQIGKLATRRPHSIGLFKPDYPFLPSGRRRRQLSSISSSASTSNKFKYDYSLDPTVMNSNVMKHGWTATILDDDVKLSVPDESRRSRQTSLYTRELVGKKWYRWRPGEGWVYSRTKDFSAYRHGPGIALGQLLPPRDKAVTSQLPYIPNDSKRDFVWLLVSCMIFFASIALLREYRQYRRRKRKGKKRNRSLNNGHHSLIRPRSVSSVSTGESRQPTQVESLQNIIHSVLRKSFSGVGQAANSTTNGLTNIGWASTNGKGISSGRSNGRAAVRRGASIYHEEDEDGSTFELLEKGGIDGSAMLSPAKEDIHFDLHQVSAVSPSFLVERSR